MSLLSITLRILQVYIPIVMGITYVLGYERKKLDNLLKFFVITTFISLLASLIQNSFDTEFGSFFIIPFYIYLTLFHYMYAGIAFDIFLMPFSQILMDYFYEIKKNVEKERARAKAERDQGRPARSQEGWVQGKLVDIFQPDKIYLLK